MYRTASSAVSGRHENADDGNFTDSLVERRVSLRKEPAPLLGARGEGRILHPSLELAPKALISRDAALLSASTALRSKSERYPQMQSQ